MLRQEQTSPWALPPGGAGRTEPRHIPLLAVPESPGPWSCSGTGGAPRRRGVREMVSSGRGCRHERPQAPQGRQKLARRRKPREPKDPQPSEAPPGATGIPHREDSAPSRVFLGSVNPEPARNLPPLAGLWTTGNGQFPGAHATGLIPDALRAGQQA